MVKWAEHVFHTPFDLDFKDMEKIFQNLLTRKTLFAVKVNIEPIGYWSRVKYPVGEQPSWRTLDLGGQKSKQKRFNVN